MFLKNVQKEYFKNVKNAPTRLLIHIKQNVDKRLLQQCFRDQIIFDLPLLDRAETATTDVDDNYRCKCVQAYTDRRSANKRRQRQAYNGNCVASVSCSSE